MFIEIKDSSEIFYAAHCEGHTLALTYPCAFNEINPFLLNINHIQRIYVGKVESKPSFPFRCEQKWTNLLGVDYIGFYIPENDSSNDSFTLFFKENAMGEFHRIKRILDDLIEK